MIQVGRRAHHHEDRAGDPLDGLVNLFDLGIVLSVAFLLAALSSLNLSSAVTKKGLKADSQTVVVKPDEKVSPLPAPGGRTVGKGVKVGNVYRLDDGRLIYVQGSKQP